MELIALCRTVRGLVAEAVAEALLPRAGGLP